MDEEIGLIPDFRIRCEHWIHARILRNLRMCEVLFFERMTDADVDLLCGKMSIKTHKKDSVIPVSADQRRGGSEEKEEAKEGEEKKEPASPRKQAVNKSEFHVVLSGSCEG